MHDDDKPTTTAAQDDWQSIATLLRDKVRASLAHVPTMRGKELLPYMEALRQAILVEQDALAFDRELELRLNRHNYSE